MSFFYWLGMVYSGRYDNIQGSMRKVHLCPGIYSMTLTVTLNFALAPTPTLTLTLALDLLTLDLAP